MILKVLFDNIPLNPKEQPTIVQEIHPKKIQYKNDLYFYQTYKIIMFHCI